MIASIDEVVNAVARAREAGRPASVLLGSASADRRPTWAQIGIARLAALGFTGRIVTTAAHRMLERACAMEDLTPEIERIPAGGSLSSAPGEIWLLAGCGPRDGIAIAEGEVYWAGWCDQPPPDPRARHVADFDADSLFAYLMRRLDQFPPESVERLARGPWKQVDHLLSGYESQFSLFVQEAVQKKKFRLACAASDDPSTFFWMWGSDLMEQARNKPAEAAEALLAEALDKLRRGYDPAKAYSMGFKELLQALRMRARYRTDADAGALYQEADALAAAAAKRHKLDAEKLGMWAETLAEWASRSGDGAQEKLARAVALYEEAIKLAPQNAHLRAHLGEMLQRSGRRSEARAVFQKMGGAQSKGWLARYELGLNGLKQARSQTASDPEPAVAEASEHFEAALAGAPERKADILCDWGSALGELAASRHGDVAERLFSASFEKLAAAAQANPHFHRPYKNWSSFLLHQAHHRPAEAAALLRAEAREKCLKANQIKPGCSLYDLACIAASEGNFDEVRARLEAALDAGTLPPVSHMETDADLAVVRVEPWFLNFISRLRLKPSR